VAVVVATDAEPEEDSHERGTPGMWSMRERSPWRLESGLHVIVVQSKLAWTPKYAESSQVPHSWRGQKGPSSEVSRLGA
jgi:hypothetical protein